MLNNTESNSKIIKIESVEKNGKEFISDIIELFLTEDFAKFFTLIRKFKNIPSTIRDGIFWNCLETYLLNTYEYNEETKQFEGKYLKSLSVALAEASPNSEANYRGDPDKLSEYAKRLIKLIDDCTTKQKAYYLACLTRAILSKSIDTQKFFQLSRCIRNLTEEDLSFLTKNIKTGDIPQNEDYIDDYRSLGLIYETTEGFSYTKRAFELKKFALCYEENIQIPEIFPSREEKLILKEITEEEIIEEFNNAKQE